MKSFRSRILISVIIFIFFASINVSKAYNLSLVRDSTSTSNKPAYRLSGSVLASDLVYSRSSPWNGLYFIYNNPEISSSSHYNTSDTCSLDPDGAARLVNSRLAMGVTLEYGAIITDSSGKLDIFCKIGTTSSQWMLRANLHPTELCTVSVPSEANFGNVGEGETKSITVQALIKCDQKSSVRLTLSASGGSRVLTMSGTVVQFTVGEANQSAVFPVASGGITAANLNFTVSETGQIAGEKQGYVLLVSEIL